MENAGRNHDTHRSLVEEVIESIADLRLLFRDWSGGEANGSWLTAHGKKAARGLGPSPSPDPKSWSGPHAHVSVMSH